MKRKGQQKRLGAEIIEGLTDLCETMEKGEPVESKFTVRTVELNLVPREYDPQDVRDIRNSLNVSQAVFAQILATSVECVESWEQGIRKVPPMARRLLDLINGHRDHWVKVLKESKRLEHV